VTPEVRELAVEAGDVFLLCSDGLTRELPDAAIGVVLGRDGSLEERVTGLVDAALRAGGRDNVTCLLVEVG
jgi:serine/threonine protein phosphatase PrpC